MKTIILFRACEHPNASAEVNDFIRNPFEEIICTENGCSENQTVIEQTFNTTNSEENLREMHLL